MRLITEAIVALAILANQVITTVPVPFTDTAQAAEAQAVETSNYTLTFTTSTPSALALQPKTSSFDTDVVAPLKAAQAQAAAAQAAAQAAAAQAAQSASQAASTAVAKKAPVIIGGDDAFAKLRLCEAGGDYSKNTGNGYYGAYQYDIRTWANFGGFARADLAPPEVQDAKARATQAARGWSPWPGCARKLGLL